MFNSFPILTEHMLDVIYRQGFRYVVQQVYPNYFTADNFTNYLLSPFYTEDKADYYFKRLSSQPKDLFHLHLADSRCKLLENVNIPETRYHVKILEKKFQPDKYTRHRIALYFKLHKPELFARIIHTSFRISIADNFGEIFYKVRIGAGTEIPITEVDLCKITPVDFCI